LSRCLTTIPWFRSSIGSSAITPISSTVPDFNILEPAAAALEVPPSSIGEVGVLVNVANWTDSNPPKLEVHEPELTNATVALGADGEGS
jgi:hypothetical protein